MYLTVRAGPHAPRAAREALRDWLLREQLQPLRVDLMIILSELVTNAVDHGSAGDGAATVSVMAALTGDGVRVTVMDPGAPAEEPEVHHPLDDEVGGRGLLLVDALSSRWGSAHDDLGRVVWAELDLQGPADESGRPGMSLSG